MISTFTCKCCGKLVPRNTRIKKKNFVPPLPTKIPDDIQSLRQRVTNSSECRCLRRPRNKHWRDNYPAHEYQKEYRKKHPEYINCNPEGQRERNKKRKPERSSMIVKTYTLPTQMHLQSSLQAFSHLNC